MCNGGARYIEYPSQLHIVCNSFIRSLHYMYVKYKYIGMNEMAFETRDHNERSCFYNNIELS